MKKLNWPSSAQDVGEALYKTKLNPKALKSLFHHFPGSLDLTVFADL